MANKNKISKSKKSNSKKIVTLPRPTANLFDERKCVVEVLKLIRPLQPICLMNENVI